MANKQIVPIEPVARALLEEPNKAMSRAGELRFGTHGSLAVDLEKDGWYDHEEGVGGGVLELIARQTGLTKRAEQLAWLEEHGLKEPKEAPKKARAPRQASRIVETYDYVDANGELVFQVVRKEPKKFLQRRPFRGGWAWKLEGKVQKRARGNDWVAPDPKKTEEVVELPPMAPQPPYHLPQLLANPEATVYVAEGEKDVHRLEALGLVATCNAAGANKWPDSINQHLAGRRVAILPDNDESGRDHARKVRAALEAVGAEVRVVPLPGLPEKGDVSDWLDAGGDVDQLQELVEQAAQQHPEPLPEPARPFRALGYSDESYFYLPRGTEQVSVIGRGAHTSSSNMLALAPLDWWEAAYPKDGPSGGVDWQLAASDCMRQCEQAGVYDARNVRGRGAWYDSGESVLHLGDRLIVGGEVRQIAEHQSRHIYTRQAPMESIIDAPPATAKEGREVFDLIQKLNWSLQFHGLMMAGFTFLAPICGALKWRPHVWLTSQRGAGKSWTQENIVKPLLGQSVLVVQGSTTEAGIRQALRQDARPVMFDEAESEDAASQRRMKGVIELARQSSSDSSAEIAKGTVGGNGMSFRARSMFLMGSINVSLSSAADETRFSVVSLEPPKRTPEGIAEFGALQHEVVSTLNTERCAAMRARAYHLIPVIRQNADTMARAVAERLGSQRVGDQVGTLLAGAIAMLNDKVVTIDEARAWVASLDLEDAQEAESVSDELMCLQTILQHQVSVEAGSRKIQRAISELVAGAASKQVVAEDFYAGDCNAVLERHGLKVDRDALLVSNTHAELKRILRDTQWASGWNRLLRRIPGSLSPLEPKRFAGTRTRSVKIPLSAVI